MPFLMLLAIIKKIGVFVLPIVKEKSLVMELLCKNRL